MTGSSSKDFANASDLPRGYWPRDASPDSGWRLAGEHVWQAEWAPLRERKFCQYLARQAGEALVSALGEGAPELRVEIILNDDDRRLLIMIRFGVPTGAPPPSDRQIAAINDLLENTETTKYWIWSAINATAYKGVAD
ncbi:MAG: hypothetical protein ACE5DK_00470 [Paracoccaceae bacterium]